jgi:hypothetical protein
MHQQEKQVAPAKIPNADNLDSVHPKIALFRMEV